MTQQPPEPRDAWEQAYLEREGRKQDAQDAREQAYREQKERERADGTGLIGAGIAMSILLPIVGFVIGIVLLFKNRVGPGLGCILLSGLVAAIVAVYVVPELFPEQADAAGIESEIREWASEGGAAGSVTSVTCPEDVDWEVGGTFDCSVKLGAETYTVTVTMEDEVGYVTWEAN